MPNPTQEPPVSPKGPNKDLNDVDDLFNFNIKIESQNSGQGCIKDQLPFANHQNSQSQSETSSVLQIPKCGLKGYGGSLHLQNQDREPKFVSGFFKDQ